MHQQYELRVWLHLSLMPGSSNQWLHLWDAQQVPIEEIPSWLLSDKFNLSVAQRTHLQRKIPQFKEVFSWLGQSINNLVVWSDARFPAILRQLSSPPVLLFARGNLSCFDGPAVAVVGARKCSYGGKQFAGQLGFELASNAKVVVSGMALGIDAAAHNGALKAGRTIAVVATGLDLVYPPQHVQLADQISACGLLLSSFMLASPPKKRHFIMRNHLISGLCLATAVVEAAERSGSLTTARAALDQGRDVWAVPWSPTHPLGVGCLQLLADGAGILRSAQDLLSSLPAPSNSVVLSEGYSENAYLAQGLDPDCLLLLECINLEPVSAAVLQADTGMDITRCARALARLELAGVVHSGECGYTRSI